MKKQMGIIFGIAAAFSVGAMSSAHADVCSLKYEVHGGGLQVGLGYFKMKGFGRLSCIDVYGRKQVRPVRVTIGSGFSVAPRVAVGGFKMYGESASFGFDGSMNEIYGHYLVASGQGAIGLGAGADVSLHNPLNGLRLSLGISGSEGLGAAAGLSVMEISPVN